MKLKVHEIIIFLQLTLDVLKTCSSRQTKSLVSFFPQPVKVVRRSNVSSAAAQDKLHLETSFSQTPACKTPFAAEAHNSQLKLLDSSNVVEYSEAAPLLQQHTQDSKTFNTEAANCVASPILDEVSCLRCNDFVIARVYNSTL